MTPRRYVTRNHPAMPKAPMRGIRMSIDFPDVEAMLAFRDVLNKLDDTPPKLHCYKLDFFDIEEMPIGNHYILSPKTNKKVQELTRKVIELQETQYKQTKPK